jgi:IS1 family transposase
MNIYKVNSDVNAFEAYTEFWAEIINSVFCSYYATTNNNIHEFLSNFEFYINFERTYSIFQLVKTLDFMGLQYKDLYSISKKSGILRENLYKENTNVLSYYIIKTVLINNYQGFLNWCKTNNLSLLDFKKTIGNQKQFCKFIEKNYKIPSMLHGIHESHIFLSNIKKKKENNKFILSNMRMSICELG